MFVEPFSQFGILKWRYVIVSEFVYEKAKKRKRKVIRLSQL